jgi:hypothetical protein
MPKKPSPRTETESHGTGKPVAPIPFEEALRRMVTAPPHPRHAAQRQNDKNPGDEGDPRRPDRRDT